MFEAIILAGGLGTRLRPIIKEVPKPMAPLKDKPFLHFLLKYLKKNQVQKIILAVSYKKELIVDYFKNSFEGVKIEYSLEENPLGTGGALKQSLEQVESENVFVLNGDTYFDVDLRDFYEFHENRGSEISLALKLLNETARYGTVILDEKGKIIGFQEKENQSSAIINGGIYVINKKAFLSFTKNFPEKFSFEKDVLPSLTLKTFGKVYDGYFIDIGIPEDYLKATKEIVKLLES